MEGPGKVSTSTATGVKEVSGETTEEGPGKDGVSTATDVMEASGETTEEGPGKDGVSTATEVMEVSGETTEEGPGKDGLPGFSKIVSGRSLVLSGALGSNGQIPDLLNPLGIKLGLFKQISVAC
jgi:hypothetical protein